MSNTIDNIFNFGAAQSARCRVAYSLNNEQPVKCSIISDEPLFYMDFEGDMDVDEEYGEIFDFTDIESGVTDLEERITGLENFSGQFGEDNTEERFSQFLDNLDFVTKPFEGEENRIADIRFLENILRESRLVGSLLDFAAKYGTKLSYDAQVDGALYDRKGAHIYINPYICREDQILLAARELRRVWQHRNGVLLSPLTFHPDQAVLVNRAQIADLTVMMIRTAWELQLAGEKAVWERIENSSMADLGRAFARESHLDFRTLNNGVAASAVFECWFLSERCRNEDKKLIQMMLADYQGYVFDIEQSSQSITAELIVTLGSMPFGKNYLAPYVGTIINEAIFTEIRDRSNANFLWFIKFERSFRETEQELQTEEANITGHNDLCDLSQKNKMKRFGDHEEETTITTLPRGRQNAASSENGRAGNIIPFQDALGRKGSGEA